MTTRNLGAPGDGLSGRLRLPTRPSPGKGSYTTRWDAAISTAGTSITATMAANQLIDTIDEAQQHLTNNPDYFLSLMRQNGIEPPPALDLHFHIFDEGGYGVIERQTGVAWRLGN